MKTNLLMRQSQFGLQILTNKRFSKTLKLRVQAFAGEHVLRLTILPALAK